MTHSAHHSNKSAAVSIALAACNGAEYIAGQLESLLKQTQVPDEIVISDDSTDERTFEAIKPFLSDSRIVYVKNTLHHGVGGNFANALQHCSNEYIFLCDQDDVWLPGKVERLAGVLCSTPELDGVFCNSMLTDEQLRELGQTLFQVRKFTPAARHQLESSGALKLFLKRVPCSGHNLAFKRRWLEKLLPFPELAPFYPDTWIALLIASAGKWRALDEVHTLYRVHQQNQSQPCGNQLTAARKARQNNAALRNALLAAEILTRMDGALSSQARKQLMQFKKHHKNRSKYSRNVFIRLAQISTEILSGRYNLYSNSLKSAAADWLLG